MIVFNNLEFKNVDASTKEEEFILQGQEALVHFVVTEESVSFRGQISIPVQLIRPMLREIEMYCEKSIAKLCTSVNTPK
jgi:hypothetical protein